MSMNIKIFQYPEFDVIEEIGAGGYGTVYKTKCRGLGDRVVALKCFKNFDQIPKLFANEVRSH
jgi:hypothetical protein